MRLIASGTKVSGLCQLDLVEDARVVSHCSDMASMGAQQFEDVTENIRKAQKLVLSIQGQGLPVEPAVLFWLAERSEM